VGPTKPEGVTVKIREARSLPVERHQQKGVTTVEYAVMLVLVAIAVLAFGSGIAGSVTGVFSRMVSSLN
jgi:Flp pilus assembly pilin Flp